jgi:voltage-gated potassium channel
MAEFVVSQRLATWRRLTDLPLLVLAVGSLPILLLELVSHRLSSGDQRFIFLVNLTVFIAFAVDYITELFLTTQRRTYFRTQWSSLAIVIAQLLALLPALGFLGVFRAARALRIISTLARVIGIGSASRTEGRRFFREKAASFTFGLAGMTLITSAVAFTIAEDVGNGRRIDSFFDSLWWAAATITTVGYGDIYPLTPAGRIIAVFTMIVGISTLATVTARIAQFLIRSDNSN